MMRPLLLVAGLVAFTRVGANAGFYVCPAPCAAMLLPMDMETMADCLCPGNISGLLGTNNAYRSDPSGKFRCPTGSVAVRPNPTSFADCKCVDGYQRDAALGGCTSDQFSCVGRYQLKIGRSSVTSIADCDCHAPYEKDESTGQCVLQECPRAGNYVAKSEAPVMSLADCTCLEPLIKNEQSGECQHSAVFECPEHSEPTPNTRAQSFADCHCKWGFVRTPQDTCAMESQVFACPVNSLKRRDLALGARPQSFADCVCLENGKFTRNEMMHSCDLIPDAKNPQAKDTNPPFTCPFFSRPIAPIPHSVEQCECLPGYGWKSPEMSCVRLSAYRCPPHAYKLDPMLTVEKSFADCACASGFFRDTHQKRCLEWFLAHVDGCPRYAYLKHWPLQSRANCQCIYGRSLPTPAPTNEQGQTIGPPEPNEACNEPPTRSDGQRFTRCPENSFVSTWPPSSPRDCACYAGYIETETDPDDLVCEPMIDLETEAAIVTEIKCRAPLVENPFTGACRLPVEEVLPGPAQGAAKAVGPVLFNGLEYDYVLTDDNIMIIQGDIAIGELAQYPTADGTGQKTAHVLHGYYNSERDHRWPNASMCYYVDSSASSFAPMVSEAMQHIHEVTGFEFTMCKKEKCPLHPQCNGDFVRVTSTRSSCFSYIGRIGGPQVLGVSSDCGVGNLQHVLLHAIGLHHTIDRVDRDSHVHIAWECIPESKRSNFVIEQLKTDPSVAPYDFFSIMHHPADAFLRSPSARAQKAPPKWCQAVVPIIGDPVDRVIVLGEMGQREKLAITDIHAVWSLYPLLQQRETPVYESRQDTEPSAPPVHESRLHTEDDVQTGLQAARRPPSRLSRKLSSFVGGIVVLLGFGAVLAFAITEIRKRTLQARETPYYAESLLTDVTAYH